MDISVVYGSNYSDEIGKTPAEVQIQSNAELVDDIKGIKPDALSAVKLDPAVLEAQVTIDSAPNTSNYVSDGSCHEETPDTESAPINLNFEETLISLQENALLNLSSHQCALLLVYVNNLRRQRIHFRNPGECAFCKNNGQSAMCYTSHSLRDARGRVRCPILRALKCPRCGDTGDRAHTPKYCPKNNKRRSTERRSHYSM